MKILMVCLGNICRSPLAEGILQAKADIEGLNWSVESAGTNGYHNGEAPHRLSQQVAKEKDLDISNQRSRHFSKRDLSQYDIIYAMAPDVVDDLKYLCGNQYDSKKIKGIWTETSDFTTVPDPYYGGIDGFYKVYDMLDSVCESIIEKYRAY